MSSSIGLPAAAILALLGAKAIVASVRNGSKGATYKSIGRMQGEPQVWNIDLKWSLWSEDKGVWTDLASEVWDTLWTGIAESAIVEHGEQVIVLTRPRKEIRHGEVVFSPAPVRSSGSRLRRVAPDHDPIADLVRIQVEFTGETDDDEPVVVRDAFDVPSDEEGFWEAMKRIDKVEDRLLGRLSS